MNRKKSLLMLLTISVLVTLLGLGFSAYNYFVFDKPFMNATTKSLLSAFVLSTLMIVIGLSKIRNKEQ